MTPRLARTRTDLAAMRGGLPAPVVVVPTMGALHAGHRALLRRARELAGPDGSVLATIFVNPLQFGPAEDFDRYPRPLDADLEICAAEGVAAVFAPGPAGDVPAGHPGHRRPGPGRAGARGRIPAGLLRRRAHRRAEAVPAHPAGHRGVRPQGRPAAGARPADGGRPGPGRADRGAWTRCATPTAWPPRAGTPTCPPRTGRPRSRSRRRSRQAGTPRQAGRDRCCRRRAGYSASRPANGQALQVDYLSLVHPETFAPVGERHSGPAVLAVAARAGTTRLIDNVPLTLPGEG